MLGKLQRWVYTTAHPLLADSLESLTHRQNITSLSLFYRYYFGRSLSELSELAPLPHSQGMSTPYNRFYDFSGAILRFCKHVNSFFPMSILCLQNAFLWLIIWMTYPTLDRWVILPSSPPSPPPPPPCWFSLNNSETVSN